MKMVVPFELWISKTHEKDSMNSSCGVGTASSSENPLPDLSFNVTGMGRSASSRRYASAACRPREPAAGSATPSLGVGSSCVGWSPTADAACAWIVFSTDRAQSLPCALTKKPARAPTC